MAEKASDTQKALKSVADALKLDSENFDKDAYIKYLESVSIISSTLCTDQQLESSDTRHLTPQQRQKLIDVARQCLDRVDVLSKNLVAAVQNGNIKTLVAKQSGLREKSDEFFDLTVTQQGDIFVRKSAMLPLDLDSYVTHPSNTSILESINWVSPESSVHESPSRFKRISPLERIHRENKTLIALYKKRSLCAPNAQVRINLSLELQRRLAENLQVGHKQQEIYVRQQREQQEEQLNEITRKVLSLEEISSKELSQRRELCAKVIEYEQNHTWMENSKKKLALNPDDGELAETIVRHILCDSKHPITKEMKLKSDHLIDKIKPLVEANSLMSETNPDKRKAQKSKDRSPSPENSLESSTDSDNANSDTELCLGSTSADGQKIKDEDCDKNDDFKGAYSRSTEDVELAIKAGNAAMSSLRSTLKKQKLALKKNPITYFKKARSRKDSPENSYFIKYKKGNSEIQKMELEALQRHLENVAGDIRVATDELVEFLALTCEPLERGENHARCYGVVEEFFFPNFWPALIRLSRLAYIQEEQLVAESMEKLQDCTPVMLGFDADVSNVQPVQEEYDKAILLLKRITELQTPTKKLEVLVLVAKTLCEKQSQSKDIRGTANIKPIGADDLIPLLSYVCIQSRISNLILECNLLEHLILQKYLMGEAGYCLTSLQTALQYIQTFELRNNPGKRPETTV